jgi:DNA-binding NarL/FixJ family response regulator
MGEQISVFLVDDHAVVRRGLASYLDGEDDIEVIGQAEDGQQALAELAVSENGPAGLPDVVLMDLLMPRMGGVEAIEKISRRWSAVKVIAVTSFLEEDKVKAALDAGAAGYLLKDSDADAVAQAIRTVAKGEVALQPSVARTLIDMTRRPEQPVASLTGRERQVILLVAEGFTNQQIASRLVMSERTARTHVSNILAKLGLTSRTQAAMWAERNQFTSTSRS